MRSLLLVLPILANLAHAGPHRLDPNPSIISLIYYEPAENFSSSFGHVDLRISYGKVPNTREDIAVGFGPEVKAGYNPGALEYLGIGKKLGLISWTESFEVSYFNASRERMIGVISMELDLTPDERRRIVSALNQSLSSTNPPSYHAIFKNCATEIADMLANLSRLKKGWFSFHPGFLEKKLGNYTRNRTYYPSGRQLKSQVLTKYKKEYEKLFLHQADRGVFEAQLMSAKTEFRILAYRKLLARGAANWLLKDLMKTESPRRQKLIEAKISDASYLTYEYQVENRRAHQAKKVEIKGDKVVVSFPNIANGPASKNNLKSTPSQSWSLRELGINPSGAWRTHLMNVQRGSKREYHFWIARDLYLDPK